MTHELEIAAVDAALSRRGEGAHGHGPAPGARCANCGVELQGPWCHRCGQLWEDFHRSTWKLMGEAVEGLLHFDSRMWRTLPDLFLRPAKLTRAYLDGHRASQISPLRLFLVVLLAVFLAGAVGAKEDKIITVSRDAKGSVAERKSIEGLSPEEKEAAKKAIEQGRDKLNFNVKGRKLIRGRLGDWASPRIEKVLDDPERFKLILESWSERFAFLALPMAAGLLSVLYVFQRRFFFYDHLIFSLHSLSAFGAVIALSECLGPFVPGLAKIVLVAVPIHLFVHMRGVYGSSVLGTLIRMLFLFIGSVICAAFLVLGLLLVGLNGMGA